MSEPTVQERVAEEIHWDPKVDAQAIAVSARDGVVTLRGTGAASIRSVRQRRPPSGFGESSRSTTNFRSRS
jgi:hypothetical protein